MGYMGRMDRRDHRDHTDRLDHLDPRGRRVDDSVKKECRIWVGAVRMAAAAAAVALAWAAVAVVRNKLDKQLGSVAEAEVVEAEAVVAAVDTPEMVAAAAAWE